MFHIIQATNQKNKKIKLKFINSDIKTHQQLNTFYWYLVRLCMCAIITSWARKKKTLLGFRISFFLFMWSESEFAYTFSLVWIEKKLVNIHSKYLFLFSFLLGESYLPRIYRFIKKMKIIFMNNKYWIKYFCLFFFSFDGNNFWNVVIFDWGIHNIYSKKWPINKYTGVPNSSRVGN